MRSKSQSKKNGLSSVEENLRLEGQVPGLARTMVRSLSEERSITRPSNEEALQTPAPIPNPRGSRQSYRDQKPLHFYLVSVTEWMEPQFWGGWHLGPHDWEDEDHQCWWEGLSHRGGRLTKWLCLCQGEMHREVPWFPTKDLERWGLPLGAGGLKSIVRRVLGSDRRHGENPKGWPKDRWTLNYGVPIELRPFHHPSEIVHRAAVAGSVSAKLPCWWQRARTDVQSIRVAKSGFPGLICRQGEDLNVDSRDHSPVL